ncbi:UvrD-helicase domain-containing protein [Salibacterium halotolerans]|uniref:DNA helicase-2 / ATP-dependent DNA helicase PcrA n=1 Tax=Salibacterium halotolerans TaxID=1884432 RepID=A0A1I5P965_9BACI|nr:UvrD-helicase domain-containing protein [Salibacterium halotolerans]SFP30513.1 DNA helicase-2 / ATP-dependent DNA helicase PcrA [Salibacterium halotolerans]
MSNCFNSVSKEEEIFSYLDLDNPKSFFLFAGAGSGKTRSLVEALKRFRAENIDQLRRKAQKVAIITYTNAACDEIKRRLEFDSTFHVSTIHSFAWELIKPYTNDIKEWLVNNLKSEIIELNKQQSKVKNTETKTYADRESKIAFKTKRIESLDSIRKFSYNPNGENTGKGSLNHSEVIKISAEFIQNRPLMQSILVRKYPILLIDESQDTKKELIDAFFEVQKNKSECFALGMFGDTMQRIYNDGKKDLGQNIPATWAKPAKEINYRCPKRVVTLINKIRSSVDGQEQKPNKEIDGIVRLFVIDARKQIEKAKVETDVFSRMAILSGDNEWNYSKADVKVLTLEHHMAASRDGFSPFFEPLYAVDKLKNGLLDGTLSGVSLFANQVLPLVKARQSGDQFEVARIARKYSPLLSKEVLQSSSDSVQEIIKTKEAVNSLCTLWDNNNNPPLNLVLREVFRSGLFQIPEALIPIAKRLLDDSHIIENDQSSDKDSVIDAWDEALKCLFSQFEQYVQYINDQSRFGTHQGIKGLEFPRVMVVLDDEEAKGFLFSYEKLLGAKELSKTDIKNQSEGKDTSIERTRRLFYVTCSRAERNLAIVAYTKEPEMVRDYALSEGWFEENEVIYI